MMIPITMIQLNKSHPALEAKFAMRELSDSLRRMIRRPEIRLRTTPAPLRILPRCPSAPERWPACERPSRIGQFESPRRFVASPDFDVDRELQQC